ncbi:MAG: murein transglycosylase domain-containing protein [Nautiliaceae bacterium]|jgi:membrane-bound lytic murein transglycosylase C
MKRAIISLILLSSLNAQSFDEFKKNQTQEFNTHKNNLQKEFQAYKETLNKEFNEYKKSLSKFWKEPKLTTKKTFVEYSKDLKTRKEVDFKNKKIKIEVIAITPQEALQKAKKALKTLVTETTKTAFNNNPVLKKVDEKFKNIGVRANLSNRPIVKDVIFKTPPSQSQINSYVKNHIKLKNFHIRTSKVKNSKVYLINIPLPSDTYIKKAKNLKPIVAQKSYKLQIPPYLIYAIIETESSYNPMARSYVPAFGLMQIVPSTAGRDAYKMLYGTPKLLTPSYLYNENNNILIGTAYLKKLYYIYFRGVKNKMSRLYLTIAAYNTGSGNVACAFNSNNKDFKGNTICYRVRGDYSIKKALPKINSLSSKEVYKKLINNLRYEEARNYLQKVYSRLKKYFYAIKQGKI